MTYELIIVGGGVWGCSAALRALEKGVSSVLLIEANPGVAQESSAKAGGIVTDLLWNAEDREWVDRSRILFRQALEASGDKSILQTYGMLTLFEESDEAQVFARFTELREARKNAEIWAAEKIVGEFPDLDGLESGTMALWTPDDEHANATAYSEAVLAMAKNQGLTVRFESQVTGLSVGSNQVKVQVGSETVLGNRVLVAAGTWSKKLLSLAGFQIPLRPYRAQLASLDMPSGYQFPLVWELSTDIYLVPDGSYNLLAGDGTRLYEYDPDAYDADGDEQFISAIATRVLGLTSRADDAGLRSAWAGLCGATPDRRPLVGAVTDRLFVACGDQGIGIMRGPAIGELAADIVLGEASAPHLSPLRSSDAFFPIRGGFTLV